MLFTNKHVVIAIIVSPILAVLAWYGVGQITGEKPQAAQQGSSYPLVEKSNCRWESGQCDLANEGVKLNLTLDNTTLAVSSSLPLERILVSVDAATAKPQPSAMTQRGDSWLLDIKRKPGAQERIRLVAYAGGSLYFADASTTFTFGDGGIPGSEQ